MEGWGLERCPQAVRPGAQALRFWDEGQTTRARDIDMEGRRSLGGIRQRWGAEVGDLERTEGWMGGEARAWVSTAAGWGLRGKRCQWAWERAARASLGAAGLDGLNKAEQSCSLDAAPPLGF